MIFWVNFRTRIGFSATSLTLSELLPPPRRHHGGACLRVSHNASPLPRPSRRIIPTHPLDPVSLPASELGLFTPSLSVKPPRCDAKKVTSRSSPCQPRPFAPLSLRRGPPDSTRSDSCISRVASLRYFHLVPGCNHTASCSRARRC